MRALLLGVMLLMSVAAVAQITTTCSLYGNTASCTSYDYGSYLAERQREQYQAGQQLGRALGYSIFRARFPGWRRSHCAQHPGQPFDYRNASGDAITGTCPTQDGLANEAATEWMAKHLAYTPNATNGTAIDAFIADKHLARWEPKSYDQAYKALLKDHKLEK